MTAADRIAIAPALSLSPIGCGTWAWGNRLLWGYDTSMDAQLESTFQRCLAKGITWFDTGDSYGTGRLNGRSEQLLGEFAGAYTGPNLDALCIATKLAVYPWRLTRQSLVAACMKSSRRLGRPVDLAQLHWSPKNYLPWQEGPLLDGLAELWDRGLVKAIGLSNYGPIALRRVHKRFSEQGIPLATLQVQYSLLATATVSELDIKAVCDELGVRLIAYSPLTLGLLTGKYDRTNLPGGLRSWLFRRLLPGAKPLLDCQRAIANARGKTMAQVALNWCVCKGTIPIPGAKHPAQATDNLGALGWSLDAGEIEDLDRAAARVKRPMMQNIFQTR
ncbi:aldo/keto reductase [Rubidibacter lacunae]|nr:aldo/keto reductase [Rubidibacter lacunae]